VCGLVVVVGWRWGLSEGGGVFAGCPEAVFSLDVGVHEVEWLGSALRWCDAWGFWPVLGGDEACE